MQANDIRFREWMNNDTKLSKALRLFIELENIFYDIDELDIHHHEFEDFMLQIGELRKEFTNLIDKDLTLLDLERRNEI